MLTLFSLKARFNNKDDLTTFLKLACNQNEFLNLLKDNNIDLKKSIIYKNNSYYLNFNGNELGNSYQNNILEDIRKKLKIIDCDISICYIVNIREDLYQKIITTNNNSFSFALEIK